jgi:hypothetical protein
VKVCVYHLSSIKLTKFSHRTNISFYHLFTITATVYIYENPFLENIS